MTDSEDDLFPNTYQNEVTTISVKGPHTKPTSVTLFPWNNMPAMQMQRNFERPRYAESCCDQRSIYNRREREISPMSMHSEREKPRNIYNSYYHNGMNSQRSNYNGRGNSPMSVRSNDTTASVSAADIAMVFRNTKFNQHEIKVIKDAYRNLMKRNKQTKISKRRHHKKFLRRYRRNSSGEDSSEKDSSLSSDDKSIKTSVYRENMSSCRSTKSEFTNFRANMQTNNIYRDSSVNSRQNSFRNMFSIGQPSMHSHSSLQRNPHNIISAMPIDRFKSGFLLPSQRFNQSVASTTTIQESFVSNPRINQCPSRRNVSNNDNLNRQGAKYINTEIHYEEDEILNTEKEKSVLTETKSNRRLNAELTSERKKLSPIKKPVEKENVQTLTNNTTTVNNNFVFAKPILPVRKLANAKHCEVTIASSIPFITTMANNSPEKLPNTDPLPKLQTSEQVMISGLVQMNDKDQAETSLNSTDLSMRPSFIKRKLFTQKLDVAEKHNMDNVSSPQTGYDLLQKERTKARKLATTQSCLSRDVNQANNNLLDLIHKIVPPECMNITNQTNKTSFNVTNHTNKTSANMTNKANNKNKSQDSEDKWDVNSIISRCISDEASDTYTDEEIFVTLNKKAGKVSRQRVNDNKTENKKQVPKCNVVDEKIRVVNMSQINVCNEKASHSNVAKKSVQPTIKSFWDTDLESDLESQDTPKNHIFSNIHKTVAPVQKTITVQQNKIIPLTEDMISTKDITIRHNGTILNSKFPLLKTNNTLNSTTDNVYKCMSNTFRIRSHRTPKRKKCCNVPDLEPPLKKTKTQKNDISVIYTPTKIETNKNTGTKAKQQNIISKTDETSKDTHISSHKQLPVGVAKNKAKGNEKNTTTKPVTKKSKIDVIKSSIPQNQLTNDLSRRLRSKDTNLSSTSLDDTLSQKENNSTTHISPHEKLPATAAKNKGKRNDKKTITKAVTKKSKIDVILPTVPQNHSTIDLCKSLRSRDINLSNTSLNETITRKENSKSTVANKTAKKPDKAKTRQSNISFTLSNSKASETVLTNKRNTNIAKQQVTNNKKKENVKNTRISDVSFSIKSEISRVPNVLSTVSNVANRSKCVTRMNSSIQTRRSSRANRSNIGMKGLK